MTGDAVGRLAICEINRNSDNLLSVDWEVEWVRDRKGAIGNAYAIFSREGDLLQSLWLNLVNTGCIVGGQGDCDGSNGKIRATKDVRDLESNLLGCSCQIYSLTDSRVCKDCPSLILYFSLARCIHLKRRKTNKGSRR